MNQFFPSFRRLFYYLIAIVSCLSILSNRASAYEINTASWGLSSTSTSTINTVTLPSGITVSVTGTGKTTLLDPTGYTAATSGATTTMYTPNIATSTPMARILVQSNDCLSAGVCSSRGTLTYTFSKPVTDPIIHFLGIGGDADNNKLPDTSGIGTKSSEYYSSYTLASALNGATPVTATLGEVSTVANNLQVVGSVISVSNTGVNTQCNTTHDIANNIIHTATAGCGSVQITGTVTSLTFNVGLDVTLLRGDGNMPASPGDGVGTTVSLSQDYSDAPATYNVPQAPAHIIGDLTLGSSINAENPGTANAATSPVAVAAGTNNNGSNGEGITDDAITTFAQLTTATTDYSLTVPISGASKPGMVCGWIDFNRNGTFESATEGWCNNFNPGDTSVVLDWPDLIGLTAGNNYVRLRASYDTGGVQSPTGRVDSGEVEDYRIPILTAAKLSLQKALPKGRFAASDQFVLSMTGASSVTTTGTDTSGVGSVTSAAVSNTNATIGTASTLSEVAAGTTNLSNYTTTYACANTLSGGQTLSGNGTTFTVTPAAGDNLSCTFTNTRKSTTLTLQKIWASGSTANDKINIPATTGFINNTALLSSTAVAAGNTTTGTAVTVYAGESGTLGAETFTVGSSANYNATLACSGNSTALSGNTLTITAADTAITCTYTNTRLPLLSVTKTSNGPWPIGQTGATYTLTPSNTGKTATSSSPAVTVRDVLPNEITANWTNPLSTNGWSCTFSGQTVTCTSSATIAAGASGTNIVLPVNVVGPAGTVTNYASIGGGGDTRNGGAAPTPGASCTPSGMCTSVNTTVLALDYGEDPTSAPGSLSGNSYKTLLAETPSGARHGIVAGVRLGATEVADTDGTPVTFGSDITASDNDGVQFNPADGVANLLKMSVTGTLTNDLTVTASAAGYLNAWIDFDQNGLFDSGEQIFTDKAVVAGSNALTFTVPNTTITGLTYARFRFTTKSGVATTSSGLAPDGEVEDYAVKVTNVLAPTSCVSSPAATIGFNLRWFDAASTTTTYRLYQRVGTLSDGTLVDMAFSSSTPVTYSSSTGVTTQPLPGNQSVGNGGYKSSIYTAKFYKSGTTTPVSMGIINLLTDIDGVSGSLGELAGAPAPAPIGANTSEHVAWHTSQVYEAQYSSNAQLYLSSNPFTGVSDASSATAYDSMAVGKYGNTLGSPSLGNNTYPDTTAKAVRLLTLPLSQMDWLYYGGQFGTSNIDLNGSTSITLTCPDLKIAKTGSAASVPAGTDYTYTLTVTNTTSYIEPSATVTDTLPAGLTFVSADNSGTYDSTTHKVTWNLGAIATSGTKVVTVTVTAPNVATVMAGTTNVTNTASVTGAGDNNSANDTANATTTFLLADLGIAKSGPPSVLAGNNYTYTLTVSNTTALPSTSAVATDTLPTGLTFVSASNSGTYDSTTRKVTWNLGTVVANSVTAVTVTVTAPSAAAVEAGTISVTNTARVSSTGDNNSANDTANATTAIGLATLTKTVRNVTRNTAAGLTANGGPNDVLEYCLNYINKGGADLLNFVLTDSVPANLDAITSNTGTGNNVSSTGYDTAANGAGFAGSSYGIQWIKAATSYLTSPSDTDSGSLTSTGGTYNKGLLTLNVGTLAAGASGTACFRASIH